MFWTAEINVIYAKLYKFRARLLGARPLHEPRGRNITWEEGLEPLASHERQTNRPLHATFVAIGRILRTVCKQCGLKITNF